MWSWWSHMGGGNALAFILQPWRDTLTARAHPPPCCYVPQEVNRQLMTEFQCAPVFLPLGIKDRFYKGMCKQIMWPMFHYVLPMSPTSNARFDPNLWQVRAHPHSRCGARREVLIHRLLPRTTTALAPSQLSRLDVWRWRSVGLSLAAGRLQGGLLSRRVVAVRAQMPALRWSVCVEADSVCAVWAGVHRCEQEVRGSASRVHGTGGRLRVGARLPPHAAAHAAAQALPHGTIACDAHESAHGTPHASPREAL